MQRRCTHVRRADLVAPLAVQKKAMVSNPEANKLKDPFATPQPSRKPDLRPSSSPAAPQRGPATAGARQAADGRKMSQNPKKQPKGRSGKKSKK